MTEQEINFKDYVDQLALNINEKLEALKEEFLQIVSSNDLRYQQRFEAQGRELDKAFAAAKEAVSQALAGADKAAIKTEQTADKRFADLGDLIKEQFKGSAEKLDATVKRIEVIEKRLNTTSGESTGRNDFKADTRAWWPIIIAGCAVLVALWALFK